MPILRGAVTFARYRVEFKEDAPKDLRKHFLSALQGHLFEPIDRKSDEDKSEGFVEVENNDSTEFPSSALFYGHRALFAWRIDTLKVSSSQLKEELDRWLQTFEAENARKPSRAEKAERKAAIRQMLRSRAEPITRVHDIAWNLETERLQIWSASRKIIDEIAGTLESAFGVTMILAAPGAVATAEGLAEDALLPTPALSTAEETLKEVLDGAA